MSQNSEASSAPLTYVTQPGDSTMGIALRQLRDQARWTDIRDLNAEAFPEMGPHDYFPVGTLLVIRKASAEHPAAAALAKLVDELDGEVADLQHQHQLALQRIVVKRELLAALPGTLPLAPAQVVATSKGRSADAELVFQVSSREEVLALVKALPGVPVVMLSSGCTSFEPEERHRADSHTRVTPVGEVVYRLRSWCGQLREEFTWWTRLAGRLVEIRTQTADGMHAPVVTKVNTRDVSLDEVEAIWSYSKLPGGELLAWYGGDRSCVIPLSVHQRRGASLADAFSDTQVTVKTVRAKRCSC